MLHYYDYQDIADAVYDSLNIPEDMYLNFKNDKEANDFLKQYSIDYITELVDAELQKYDTSENVPSDIEDARIDAVDAVMSLIDNNVEDYYRYKSSIMSNAYADIVSLLKNSMIDNVVSVDNEYDPADPSVGIYGEERRIIIELSTGDLITFDVNFEDD